MKHLLLDQGLPLSTSEHLKNLGLDATHVSVLNMSKANEDEVLLYAQNHERIVVTLDSDFHSLLAREKCSTPSTIRIRIEGLRGAETATLIQQVCSIAEDELMAGAAVSVTTGGIRIRNLPIK